MDDLDKSATSDLTRRTFVARLGAAGLSAGLLSLLAAGCGSSGGDIAATVPSTTTPPPSSGPAAITDADILNFALNLEYLEAEFYSQGVLGATLQVPSNGNVSIRSNPRVNFTTPGLRQLMEEIARDEIAHVNFLRGALGGAAVARPAIDLQASFNAAAAAAGIGPAFDPFANETNFLLAAFIFEDVGVTAYMGAAPLITNKGFLEAAAGIHAVEAYHAGEIRTLLSDQPGNVQTLVQQVSDLRDSADGGGDKDQPVVVGGVANIVPTDTNGIAFSRSPSEILRIVYLGGASNGGFFPNGVNGTIRSAA